MSIFLDVEIPLLEFIQNDKRCIQRFVYKDTYHSLIFDNKNGKPLIIGD